MFKSYQLIVAILVIASLNACSNSDNKLAESVGKIGTLTVVGAPNAIKAVTPQLNDVFLKDDESITGGSAFSELLKPSPEEFSKFFYNQKSILALVTQSTVEDMEELLETFTEEEINRYMKDPSAQLVFKSDLFAKYQHIVYLFAMDDADLKAKLLSAAEQLKASLVQFEIKDQSLKYYSDSSLSNASFSEEMKRELGMCVQVPNGFKLIEHRHGFWWFEKTEGEGENQKRIGLIAHSYMYNGIQPDFSYNAICAVRDTVLKYHVKGEIKGTYMSTSESEAYPARRKDDVQLNGFEGVKLRGWWNIDGIMMSGPFIRYVLKVPDSNRVFAFEGFIYKPNLVIKEKDLRLIESIALSIK